jgi:hypothetical protein
MDAIPCVTICIVPLAMIVPAVIILGWLDRRRFRFREEKRPVQERIDAIRDDARYTAEQLEQLERMRSRDYPEKTAWALPLIDLCRRLESLAASQNPDPQEVMRLAEEAASYIREHRIKGIAIAQQAKALVILLRKKSQT